MKRENKAAIVTGVARGIGKAIALALAREGAHVVVYDINLEGAEKVSEEIRLMGWRARVIMAG